MTSLSLLDFPNEVLRQITNHLHRPNDLNSLLQTNRFFSQFLTAHLHHLATLEPTAGTPSLCWAAKQGHSPLVKLLLANETDPNIRDTTLNKSPLMWAAGRSHKDIVRILLDSGASTEETDRGGNTALIDAVSNDNIGVARLLLDRGADPDFKGARSPPPAPRDDHRLPGTALLQACRHNPPNRAMVRLLLKKGASINLADVRENTALHTAVQSPATPHHRRALIWLLLHAGADIDRFNGDLDTALHLAVHQGDKKLVKLLVACGANRCRPDSKHNVPLHIAIKKDMTSIAEILLDGATDEELICRDIYGRTPMKLVAERACPPMLKLFIGRYEKEGETLFGMQGG